LGCDLNALVNKKEIAVVTLNSTSLDAFAIKNQNIWDKPGKRKSISPTNPYSESISEGILQSLQFLFL
jgi:hypothetical protein